MRAWGDPVEEATLKQIKVIARDALHLATRADQHKGYAVPVGRVGEDLGRLRDFAVIV